MKESILVVDDERGQAEILKAILEREGYNVVAEAEDGDEAVLLSEKHKPDIIFMDYLMKNLDGISATEQIKKKQPDVKVIMLTQEARPSVVSSSMKAGATNFIIKSKISDQLLNSLRRFH